MWLQLLFKLLMLIQNQMMRFGQQLTASLI